MAINRLKSNKKSNDGVSTKGFKIIAPVIVEYLTEIFNISINTGIVPDCYKDTIVIPIFKKGQKDLPDNYRPIALLLLCGKILEKLIYDRCIKFIDKYNIFKIFNLALENITLLPMLSLILLIGCIF